MIETFDGIWVEFQSFLELCSLKRKREKKELHVLYSRLESNQRKLAGKDLIITLGNCVSIFLQNVHANLVFYLEYLKLSTQDHFLQI